MKKWILDHTDIVCPICDARYSDEIVLMHGPIKHCPNCGIRLSMSNAFESYNEGEDTYEDEHIS